MEKRFLPTQIIGDKIYLKKHEIELAQKMFDYVCRDRERLTRFLPWVPYVKKVEDEIAFIEQCSMAWDNNKSASYGIYRNEDDEYTGNISAFRFDWKNESCELGYWILGKFEGKGYMRESVLLLEKNLFETGFNRIVVMCETLNERSKALPLSLGYRFEGKLRDYFRENDKYISIEVYSKLKKEYEGGG